MESLLPVLIALLGAIAGFLIGCVGIGGVIIVPALVYVFSVPVHTAIAAAMFAFLLSGLIGTGMYAQRRSIRWQMAGWLWAGAMPAALAGAVLASVTAPALIEGAVGLMAAVAGVHAWLSGRASSRTERAAQDAQDVVSKPVLSIVGAFTGAASALTGTGGPLVLVPILVWLELPVLAALGLAQAIQLPIAMLATVGNVMSGTLNPATGVLLGLGISFGTWAGARLAHALPRTALKQAVSALLAIVGASILLVAGL